jgi:hypothetical protein
MALNAQWHEEHPMLPRASFEQRAQWHLEHREACGCREIPPKQAAEMRERAMLAE